MRMRRQHIIWIDTLNEYNFCQWYVKLGKLIAFMHPGRKIYECEFITVQHFSLQQPWAVRHSSTGADTTSSSSSPYSATWKSIFKTTNCLPVKLKNGTKSSHKHSYDLWAKVFGSINSIHRLRFTTYLSIRIRLIDSIQFLYFRKM